jgi:ribosome recycling factor
VGQSGFGGGDGGARGPRPSDALAAIARDQIAYESARLSADVLSDVSVNVKVKADKLRNLAKITVPDVRKTVDRMREAIRS